MELVACSEWHLQQEDYSVTTDSVSSLQVSLWFGSTSDRKTEQQRRDGDGVRIVVALAARAQSPSCKTCLVLISQVMLTPNSRHISSGNDRSRKETE